MQYTVLTDSLLLDLLLRGRGLLLIDNKQGSCILQGAQRTARDSESGAFCAYMCIFGHHPRNTVPATRV